ATPAARMFAFWPNPVQSVVSVTHWAKQHGGRGHPSESMISRAVVESDRRAPTLQARGAPVPPLRGVPYPGHVRGFGCVPGLAPGVAPDGNVVRLRSLRRRFGDRL